MVEELMADSFLRRLTTNWLRWVAEEGPAAPAAVGEAAHRVAALLRRTTGWECGPVTELGGEEGWEGGEGEEDGPVVVEGVEVD